MQRVHFIAIGGAAMHNLAIAICKKSSFHVTGSDSVIEEPALSKLHVNGILPSKNGWFPDKISKALHAVVVGKDVEEDNPELIRAKELGLKIYSFPEFVLQQSRSKTRIVVAGSHGKTTTTAMILFVLKQLRIDADYMISSPIVGYENLVKLSYESRIAVFEGDEHLTSTIDLRPKFHIYKPHIAIITGISWDYIQYYHSFEEYVEQFQVFSELMEVQGRLIYFDGDEQLTTITQKLRRDIVPFPYNTPNYELVDGVTILKTKYGDVPLKFFGELNLQNMDAARLACRQIGVTDAQFYSVIGQFEGVSGRLEKIAETAVSVAFKDFSHSPSMLKATLKAVKAQFDSRKIIACFELNTFTSLSVEFLPQYAGSMADADVAIVYYNPAEVLAKQLSAFSPDQVKAAFENENLIVCTDREQFTLALQGMVYDNSVLMLLSSGDFTGVDISKLALDLLKV